MADQDVAAIVFDNSSSKNTKAGYAGDDGPRAVFPSVVGRQRHMGVILCFGKGVKDAYVGDEVQERNREYNTLVSRCPMEDGLVTNWDDMEKIWHHAFYDRLKVYPEEQPLLITDRFLPPSVGDNRDKMTQIVFETFMVPAFYPIYAEVSSMFTYTCETTTAIRVHSNDKSTTIVPVIDNFVLPHASTRLNIGGRDITSALRIQFLLGNKDLALTTETAQDIKHQLSYVALDPETESDVDTPWIEQPYKLPDGRMISVGEERYTATEEIFGASPAHDGPALQDAIFQAISKCDKSARSGLRENIILSGGNTRFPGYKERLLRELEKTPAPEDWLPEWKINVANRADEKDAAWIGGSILASLSTFQHYWILKKEEYDEYGPVIVRRRCW